MPFDLAEDADSKTVARDTGSPSKAAWLIRLLLPIGLLAAITTVVDASAIALLLADTDWRIVAVALVLVQGQIVASAWRWRFTAIRLGAAIPLGRAVAEYYLAGLVNMLLPGGVAGDVMRTVRATGESAPIRAVLRSVVLERLSGQAAFFVMAAGGVTVWVAAGTGRLPDGVAGALIALPAGIGLLAATAFAAGRFGPRRVRDALAGIWPDVGRAFGSAGAFSAQAVASLSIAASYVAVFALASAATGAALPWPAIAGLIPLALLSMLVPVTAGGWGVREGAAALLWPLAGLPAEAGIAAAVLYGAIVTVGALPGLVLFASRRRAVQSAGPTVAGPVVAGPVAAANGVTSRA